MNLNSWLVVFLTIVILAQRYLIMWRDKKDHKAATEPLKRSIESLKEQIKNREKEIERAKARIDNPPT